MISARDKSTGLYLPTQDGNVNSMLHRIYANLDNIKRVYMTLPAKKLICSIQMRQLENINFSMFDSKIVFLHDYGEVMYGSDVGQSRSKMKFRPLKKLIDLTTPEHVVCEFPVFIQFIHNFNNKNVQYNFNWNKVSDDDVSISAKSFDDELLIAKHFDVFLFSDIQYDYMKSKDTDNCLRIFRSIEIYSKKFMLEMSSMYMTEHYDATTAKIIDDIFAKSIDGVIFFPSRIDDKRYQFDKLSALSEKCEIPLILSNHLNVDPQKFTNVDLTYVIDYAKLIPQLHARFSYFYTLSKLRDFDIIPHEETDMHISLIEQILLVCDDAITTHKFSKSTINSYIN